MSSQRLKVIVAFVITFFLGALSGAAVNRALLAEQAIDLFDASAQGSRHGVFLWSLERKLSLSPPQKAQIDAILTRYDDEFRATFALVEPRTSEVRARTRAEIRTVLTPEQQAEFDRLMRIHDTARSRATPAASSAPQP